MGAPHRVAGQSLCFTLTSGVVAGAAGITALNAVTYLDVAVRARPPSTTPQQAVEISAGKAGINIPGDGERRENRLQGLGPLTGIAVGVAAGVAAALLRQWRPSLGLPLTAVVAGVTAMAAADGPMAALGVSNPADWSISDWLSDIVPHLAYGVVTSAVLELTG